MLIEMSVTKVVELDDADATAIENGDMTVDDLDWTIYEDSDIQDVWLENIRLI